MSKLSRLMARILPSRKAEAEAKANTTQQLPGENKHLELKNESASDFLGLTVRPGQGKGEPIAKFTNWGDDRAVAVHWSDHYLQPFLVENEDEEKVEVPGLFRGFTHHHEMTLNLVSAVFENKAYEEHIEEISKEVNEEQRRVLGEILKWFKTEGTGPRRARYLLITGPYEAMVGKRDQEKLGLSGRLVRYQEAGSALKAALYRRLPDLNSVQMDPISGKVHQLAFAAPTNPKWRWRSHLEFGHKAYAFWSAHNLTADVLKLVLREDFDVTLRLIYTGQNMQVTCVLRAQTHVDELHVFDEYDEMLLDFGQTSWERIKGRDMRDALQRTLPGAKPLPDKFNRHPVSSYDAREILKTIPKSISIVGDPRGFLMLGLGKRNQPYTIYPRTRPGVALVGPSKVSGKSTLEGVYATQYGRRFLSIPCAPNQYDAMPVAIKDFDGYVYELGLRDAHHLQDKDDPSWKLDQEAIQQHEKELFAKDKKVAEEQAERVFDMLWKHGTVRTASILPYGFQYTHSSATYRDLNYLRRFIESFSELWGDWYTRTGEILLVSVDNLSHLRSYSGADPIFGELPADTARNLALVVSDLISNGANVGIHTHVLTHAEEDFEWVAGGLTKHFGHVLQLGRDEHMTGRLYGPGDEVFEPQLGIRLPYELKHRFERRDEPEHANFSREKVVG